MTEPCILCRDIQIQTERDSLVLNDFKDDRTLHNLWRHFKSQLKKTVDEYTNDFKDDRTLNPLRGHSNSN